MVCKKTAFLIGEYLPTSHQITACQVSLLKDMNNETPDAEIKSPEQLSHHEASEPDNSEQYSATEGALSWHEYHSGDTGHLLRPETGTHKGEDVALTTQ